MTKLVLLFIYFGVSFKIEWSSLKIMCITHIVILLENMKLFYTLSLVCLQAKLLVDLNLFRKKS